VGEEVAGFQRNPLSLRLPLGTTTISGSVEVDRGLKATVDSSNATERKDLVLIDIGVIRPLYPYRIHE
jgi:hypothetical protein